MALDKADLGFFAVLPGENYGAGPVLDRLRV